MDGYSLGDIAAAVGNNEGMGGGGGLWLLIILFFLIGLGGNGFGGRGYMNGDLNTYATAASQQDILFNQRFDALGAKVNQIGDGICSSTYALNNAIASEGRESQAAIGAVKFDLANYNAATMAAIHAEGEQTRALLQANKIEELQAKINSLEMAQNLCGVVRYPTASTYNAGGNPFCGCGCGNI